MFNFIAVCFFALLAVAAAKPGVVAPLAYTAPLAYSASFGLCRCSRCCWPCFLRSSLRLHIQRPHCCPLCCLPSRLCCRSSVRAAYAATPVVHAAPVAAPLLLKK
ncbi:uncharacterized protein LOC119611982 [Lucilia sericata]|uniref:uncharacterized protein LOC119611982 n=1 Tax=Lucilia sericata TaxID=13632 RepID=UPI0018A87851|nr:uncharacterized protein LOC119611982 [Lucilia sericata]